MSADTAIAIALAFVWWGLAVHIGLRLIRANGNAVLLLGLGVLVCLIAVRSVAKVVALTWDGAFASAVNVTHVIDFAEAGMVLWVFARLTGARSAWALAKALATGRRH